MKSFDQSVGKNHNPNWLCISDHSYIILIIDGSGSRYINVIELDKHQRPDIDKISSNVKDLF